MSILKSILMSSLIASTIASADVAYQVESGNTFLGIANKFGISSNTLKRSNPDVDIDRLQVGQVLVIPISEVVAHQKLKAHEYKKSTEKLPIVNGKGTYTITRSNGTKFTVDNSNVKVVPVINDPIYGNSTYEYTTPTGKTTITVTEH